MKWFAKAPANIALIKYMGKLDEDHNIPYNASLSYTLNNLQSIVVLEKNMNKDIDIWYPLNMLGYTYKRLSLSIQSQKRFLQHLSYIKSILNYQGNFIVYSTNNFPIGVGLSSSASSFAALTKCSIFAINTINNSSILHSTTEQANISRIGSGSSCRSFFSPWALWDKNTVQPINLPYKNLQHKVIIISNVEKHISSTEAHKRVKTSPYYHDRLKRATKNLYTLINALKLKKWEIAFKICWNEFKDLHLLFATSNPPFSYMNENNNIILLILKYLWKKEGDGPLITMDAGPNIHLLYRPDQIQLFIKFKKQYLSNHYEIL